METCSICTKPKARLTCDVCSAFVCKDCMQLLPEDQFSFLPTVGAELQHDRYCGPCFQELVAPQIETYEAVMEQARELRVYFKKQSQETRLIKRKAPAVRITDCEDYHEAILRLAFLAAQTGHNAVVDLQLDSRKTRVGSHQKTFWSGSAIPVMLEAKYIERENREPSNPN